VDVVRDQLSARFFSEKGFVEAAAKTFTSRASRHCLFVACLANALPVDNSPTVTSCLCCFNHAKPQ
jgi:hypothetical protein